MATPDKAQITYTIGSGDTAVSKVIRFHAVMAEAHEVSTTITKYPAQTGFDVGNHAIRHNRKVVIKGIVTNHVIAGAEEYEDNVKSNNSRLMFSALKELIVGAVSCEVLTNLDTYSPVIFNRLTTEQKEGSTDILEFTLKGEEVQLALSLNKTTPTLLSFTPLNEEDKQARIDQLVEAGIPVPEDAILSEALYDTRESFQVESIAANGKAFITTYAKTGYDYVKSRIEYLVHTSDTEVADPSVEGSIDWVQLISGDPEALPDISLPPGAATSSICLKDGSTQLVNEAGEEFISTSLGNLKKTIYGAAYGVFGVNGDTSFGQVILSLGAECLVAGIIGTPADEFNENSLPTVEEIISGAVEFGEEITTQVVDVTRQSSITKITSPDAATNFLGGVQ